MPSTNKLLTTTPPPRFLKGHTPSSPPAKGCSCHYLAVRECGDKCPGSWGRQYWPGSSTPRRWSGKAHTCSLAKEESQEESLPEWRLNGTGEGRMAPPLYSDMAGPQSTSLTWYGRGLKAVKGAKVTVKNWPVDPTRHLNWPVSLLK